LIVVSHDRDFLDRVATSVLVSEGDGRWLEYAGGYSDMVAQRGKGVEARVAPMREAPRSKERHEKTSGQKAEAEKPAQKARLSFREQHALATLPAKMDELRAGRSKLQALLDDPELYARDPAKFAKAGVALAEIETALAAAEDEWLELEIRREEISNRTSAG
jgi:ATP-binding cassette subfamily F protein uup